MSEATWWGYLNMVGYPLMSYEKLDDAAVAEVASRLWRDEQRRQDEQRLDDRVNLEKLMSAMGALLAHAGAPPEGLSLGRHSYENFRDFVRRLHDHIDSLRPWPTPSA